MFSNRDMIKAIANHGRAMRKGDKLKGGLADKKKPSDFDPKAIAAGIKVEMEHTDDPKVAAEIARDHLTEDPHYYEKLARMESKAEAKKSVSAIDELAESLEKAGHFIGPKGGKKQEAEEDIPDAKVDAAIAAMLKRNPSPEDEQVHALAEKLGIEVDDLEERFYQLAAQALKKGDQPSEHAGITPEKARQILHDGEVNGKPLTEQQRKFFGAIGGHLPAPKKKMAKSAIDDLRDSIDGGEPMAKSMGFHMMEWADRLVGTPFEVGALECVKRSHEISEERDEAHKKFGRPWREMETMDRVTRAKVQERLDAEMAKINKKAEAEADRKSDLIEKYLDWRIERAKEGEKRMSKSMSAIEALGESLAKADIGSYRDEPMSVERAVSDDSTKLAGRGGSGGATASTVRHMVEGAPVPTKTPRELDWTTEEDDFEVLFGLGGKMKNEGSVEKASMMLRARAEARRSTDVEPELSKAAQRAYKGLSEMHPANAPVMRDRICKSCQKSHSAMLTACPHCGSGRAGMTMKKSQPTFVVEDNRGKPILVPRRQEQDIKF